MLEDIIIIFKEVLIFLVVLLGNIVLEIEEKKEIFLSEEISSIVFVNFFFLFFAELEILGG